MSIFDDIHNAGSTLVFSGATTSTYSWKHIVILVDGTNYSFYQDGNYISSVTVSSRLRIFIYLSLRVTRELKNGLPLMVSKILSHILGRATFIDLYE